jgi:hypothetical protein
MALSEDQIDRLGQEFVVGRSRGEDFINGEVEYSFLISHSFKILGGIPNINAITASNRSSDIDLFMCLQV